MSDFIPNHIGSKLGNFSEEDEHMLTPSDTDTHTNSIERPVSKLSVSKKKKKDEAMPVKKMKKKNGAKKKLPFNPNAMGASPNPAGTEFPLNLTPDEPTEELKENTPTFDAPQIEETLEEVYQVEVGQEEEVVQEEMPKLELDTEPDAAAIAESLKSMPKRKKKTSAKPRKKTKKELPVITDETVEEPEEEVLDVVETPTEPIAQEQSEPEPVQEEAPQLIQPPEFSQNDQKEKPSAASEQEERRAYVENIRTETHDFLKKLAEERKQRQLDYQAFREKLQNDLKNTSRYE
ncbi:MAG: hypothetical protein AAGA66_11425 [Bacteroidota bacterium]